jgi:hypothetical protein
LPEAILVPFQKYIQPAKGVLIVKFCILKRKKKGIEIYFTEPFIGMCGFISVDSEMLRITCMDQKSSLLRGCATDHMWAAVEPALDTV